MSRPEEKIAIIKELQSRRATMSPDKIAVLDELSSRYGVVDSTSPAAPPPDYSKSAWGVAGEQAAALPAGAWNMVKGIPEAAWELTGSIKDALLGRGSQRGQELLKSAITGTIRPLETIGRGAIELASPGTVNAPPPQAPEWREAAEFSGANLAGAVAPKIPVGKLTSGAARGALKTVTSPEALEARASANVARALNPKGTESQAAAAKIAPELSEQYAIKGLRQKTIDANLQTDFERAGRNVQMIEDYIIDNNVGEPVPRKDLLREVDDAIAALHVSGTGVVYAKAALKELARQRADLMGFPEKIPFKTLIDARRKLDDIVQHAGGHKSAISPDEGTVLQVQRSVADMFRRKVNSFHKEMERANHEYWLKRKAVDIGEIRRSKEVGSVGAELPGRGTLLDDMIATGLGGMVGGKTGAVLAEAGNIIRQFPGYSGVKARMQQSTADFMRRAPEFKGITAEFVDDVPGSATTAGSGPKFPPRPRIGDRFLNNGTLFTYSKEGWRRVQQLSASKSQRMLLPPEPPK